MAGYVPGEQVNSADVIKLNTNENPYPPSPAVAAALNGIDSAFLRRYPSPTAESFRSGSAISRHQCGQYRTHQRGDELLRLVPTTSLCGNGGRHPADLFPVLSAAEIQPIRCTKSHSRTPICRRIWFSNSRMPGQNVHPGQSSCPNGQTAARCDADRDRSKLDGLLLVDEAYVDFVDPAREHDAVPLAVERDNVLLLRTLSKGYPWPACDSATALARRADPSNTL